jgi:hypothetical protein
MVKSFSTTSVVLMARARRRQRWACSRRADLSSRMPNNNRRRGWFPKPATVAPRAVRTVPARVVPCRRPAGTRAARLTKTKRSQSVNPPRTPRAPMYRLKRRGRGCADLRLVRSRRNDASLQPPCGPPAIAGKLASLLTPFPTFSPHGCPKEGTGDHGFAIRPGATVPA